jgi:hypothetical protein
MLRIISRVKNTCKPGTISKNVHGDVRDEHNRQWSFYYRTILK